MADQGKTQNEVNKTSQPVSERTSMTITMPPPLENFPHFSQTEANGMQNEENAVSDHLAKTPTQEFANFNRQVNANGSEVDQSPKQLSGTGKGKSKETETKSSTDTYGSKLNVMPFTEKKHGTKQKKSRRSPLQMYKHCSTKDVDNDNIETDDEDGREDKHRHEDGDEYGDNNGDDDEPSESLCKRILRLGFKKTKDKKLNDSDVLEFHDPSASGNILGVESNSRDPAATSHLNGVNSNNARESERLSEAPDQLHHGAIEPDPNFITEVLYSEERAPPKVIKVEPVCDNITIIHKMVKELPEKPKVSKLKSIRQKVSSLAGRLSPLRRWSQSGRKNEARMSLRHSEVDMGALARDKPRENAERKVVNDHTNSTKDHENQTHRTVDKPGTRESAHNVKRTGSLGQSSEEMILDANANGPRELEAQVIRMTNPVGCVRTCFLSRSKSVKSVEPIIEDASDETRGENEVPESVQRLQVIREPISSNPEGTTLRRKPRVEKLHRGIASSIDEVINSNETPDLMPDVDIRGSSALGGILGNTSTTNLIGLNVRVIQLQEIAALMSGVADDSIEDDVDFGAPLSRHPSRRPFAEEPRDTESDMEVNQYERATSMSCESGTSIDQQNERETSTAVDPAPEGFQEYRILENYISTIAAINSNCYPEVQRIREALKNHSTKMDPIPESDLENDSEDSQRSNSDPPSLTDTTDSSESSTSVQQQSSIGVSRSNAIRRKRRSMRFEQYNDELMEGERQ